MNQIFTHGCSFEKGPQKQVHHHFIMETRICIMEHIMCNPYYMVVDERLFLTDKEDKINLKDETPSGTSRIQLRKEMNMILTPPLTTEIKEDDASQLYYMTSEDRERMFDECLGMRSWILNCQGKSQKKLINLVASKCLKL
ncbi:uncharacterized protein LOC142629362 isoform X1 [Castanea sativa]|uniref:uncharacterized protein LOC142629362 isoform X1 n=1 Tax=Castanea sativa TaxID=21020 RepID=UPI003F649F9F